MKRIVKSTIIALGLIIFILQPAHSQVNTEFLRREGLKDGWYHSLALGFGYYSGNSNYVKFRGDFRSDILMGLWDSFIVGNLEYQEGNDALIAHRGFAHIRFTYKASDMLIPEFFLQKEFNRFILLSDRNIAGAGLRFHIVNRNPAGDSLSKVNLYAGTGLMYENEELKVTGIEETNIMRSTNYVNFDWDLNTMVNFQIVGYFQVNTARANDYRILSDGTLSFMLIKGLKFLTGLHYRFDNEPPPGIKSYDLELNNGIRIDF